MKCEICGTQYRKIESSLICLNGHTLQNVHEVAHEDPDAIALKTKKIRRTRKDKKIPIGARCKLTRMVLFKLLFEEAKEHFQFPNDKLFKFFTGFFEFKKMELESPIKITKNEFFTLIYLNRRSEMEKKSIPYFLKDCYRDFRDLDIFTRIVLAKNKFLPLESSCYEFSKTSYQMSIIILRHRIRELTDHYSFDKGYGHQRSSDSGIILDSIEKSKHNIRGMIRNDLEMAKIYFQAICNRYSIEITKDLKVYFEKFVYTYDPNQIFVPEFDFVLFIAAYFIHQGNFEDTRLESLILTDFVCSKITFIKTMSKFVKSLDMCISPEIYMLSMRAKSIKRYRPLRKSIEFIDAFKRNLSRKNNTCK